MKASLQPDVALRAYDAAEVALSHMVLRSRSSADVWRSARAANRALLKDLAEAVGVPWSEALRDETPVRDAIARAIGYPDSTETKETTCPGG